jgi:putative flippase GtrA
MGTVLGGCVNFYLGRNWVFRIKDGKKLSQIIRYVVVWSGSLGLNICGVYFYTEVLGLHYIISKSITAVLVGVFFNFYFQKSFVFRTDYLLSHSSARTP